MHVDPAPATYVGAHPDGRPRLPPGAACCAVARRRRRHARRRHHDRRGRLPRRSASSAPSGRAARSTSRTSTCCRRPSPAGSRRRSAVLPAPDAARARSCWPPGPQDMHTLALDCLDLLLASRGVEVCNLGAQTPVASLLVAARSRPPDRGRAVAPTPRPSRARPSARSRPSPRPACPVYFAGSSFASQFFRQNTPGVPLDGTLPEAAELLATGTPPPTGRRRANGSASRAVASPRQRLTRQLRRAAAAVDGATGPARAGVRWRAGAARRLRAGYGRQAPGRPRSSVTSRWVGRVRAT